MIEQTFERNFVIEHLGGRQTLVKRDLLTVVGGVVDLAGVLSSTGALDSANFKIYDFADNKYHPIEDFLQNEQCPFVVPLRLVSPDIILIKYSQGVSETSSNLSFNLSDTSQKKERSKERTIGEVIEVVRQWRDMITSSSGEKIINLQQAAERMGISKKSLDDYYYQLRMGEQYGFDFQGLVGERIGVLRSFIKEMRPKHKSKSIKGKMQKHPKKLKMLEENAHFLKPMAPDSYRAPKPQSEGRMDSISDLNQINSAKQKQEAVREQMDEEPNDQSIKSIVNQFYSDFEFFVNEEADPFLDFEGDFRKKDLDESDQLF